MELSKLSLAQIADLIAADWSSRDPIYNQYIDALAGVRDGYFMAEPEAFCIAGVLTNSLSWRGTLANLIKVELRARILQLNKIQTTGGKND